MRARQAELVEQIEVMPDADPVAVIAPGIILLALRPVRPARIDAEPGAIREKLDVAAEEDGKPLALRPIVDRPLGDRHVVVAAVPGELHHEVTAP